MATFAPNAKPMLLSTSWHLEILGGSIKLKVKADFLVNTGICGMSETFEYDQKPLQINDLTF